MTIDWSIWEPRFERRIAETGSSTGSGDDPAHDLAHFRRVVKTARALALEEGARLEVVIPAAWLHDLINVPKNDPRRSQASRLSSRAALEFLRESDFTGEEALLSAIGHAIEAHSFSARIEPVTLEAQIVQDADRLDGLGAIGIARCFSVSGLLGRRIYHSTDPFARDRPLNDLENTVDHFYVKLFKTAETLRTRAGRIEGQRRAQYMRTFLEELAREVGTEPPPLPA